MASLLLTPALAVLFAACSAAGASPAPASPAPSAAPSVAPSASSNPDSIEHKTGATDIVLRYEEGGGFMMPAFTAAAVPHFTLYGDGTVIFRNPMAEVPPAEGSVFKMNPLRTAKLSEAQIQELLLLALSEGGLAVARPNYTNDMIADASTAIFTIEAGGIKKTVSVYALGLEMEGVADGAARAAFKKLADRLSDFDQGGTIPTDVYEPEAYRGVLFEAPGIEAADVRAWPWPDLTPADFKVDPDPNGNQFPHRAMTPAEVDLLKITDYEGGLQNVVITDPDGKPYTFSLRPLLPGETK
ncbi:MAG: putative lipoprotein [Chloroflexota bacterium]|nr:putative lipoprotein [Chloroflexota bacterium]